MKQTIMLIAICFMSICSFANKSTSKSKVSSLVAKTSNTIAKAKDLKSSADMYYYATVTINTSCGSVTFTGETGDKAAALIIEGYSQELTAVLDWFMCGGGYSEVAPQEYYA